ncbi:MAG: hypothetical protein ABIH11_08920 [Candidatus Altiarchaeota archaeon]
MEWKTMNFGIMLLVIVCLTTVVGAQSSSDLAPTNMIVDFDSTTTDSSLGAGDSGIMNLVIENTGGRRAENVQIYIPSTARINMDKRFYIGRLDASESKTLPLMIRVNKDATTGLTAVNVRISFDGYKSDGTLERNQLTTWDVPLRIYGKPSFQIVPSKTTYFKDTLDDLTLKGTLLDPVKDLEATLSSSCITVIGSSRTHVGDLNKGQDFELKYPVKPVSSGACTASIILEYTDESGTSTTDNMSIGLNIEDAGVDFKVVNISYNPTGPGETVLVKLGLKNVGKADSRDTTVSLSLSEPFVPVDTPEKYLGTVPASQYVEADFAISVGWDAEIKAYAIPMTITYKVGGAVYNVSKSIGIDVGGSVILEIISIDTSRGNVRIEVANIGTRTADGVKATLDIPQTASNRTGMRPGRNDSNRSMGGSATDSPNDSTMPFARGNLTRTGGDTQSFVSYKSDIKSNKQTTFTFETTYTGPATLTLEYTGLNNNRVTETERLNLGGSGGASSGFRMSRTTDTTGTSTTTYLIYALVVVVLLFVARKFYHGIKSG